MISGENEILVNKVLEYISNFEKELDKNDIRSIFEHLIFENGYKGLNIEYYNYTKNQTEKIKYNLLDLKVKYENNVQKVYVKLTQDGKEFMLKTLEVYKELRITMELLFLQEQFKKGAYDNAKNSVEKLKFEVSAKLEEIENLVSEIKRAPWRVNFKSIEETYDFALNQLDMEKQIFDNIFTLVQKYQNKLLDEEKLNKVNYIRITLLESRELHTKLLTKYQQITKEIMLSGEKNFWNSISKTINIDTKYLDLLLRQKDINPLSIFIFSSLKPKKSICFHNFFNNEYKKNDKKILLEDQSEEITKIKEKQEKKKLTFLKLILTKMNEKEVYLSEIIEEPNREKLNLVFYLHQLKKVRISEEPLIKKAFDGINLKYDVFEVQAIPKKIKKENFEFSEFLFKPIKDKH